MTAPSQASAATSMAGTTGSCRSTAPVGSSWAETANHRLQHTHQVTHFAETALPVDLPEIVHAFSSFLSSKRLSILHMANYPAAIGLKYQEYNAVLVWLASHRLQLTPASPFNLVRLLMPSQLLFLIVLPVALQCCMNKLKNCPRHNASWHPSGPGIES